MYKEVYPTEYLQPKKLLPPNEVFLMQEAGRDLHQAPHVSSQKHTFTITYKH